MLHEQFGTRLSLFIKERRKTLGVLLLELRERLDRIGFGIVIDNFVVDATEQYEIGVTVTFGWCLVRVVPWPKWSRGSDVTDLAYDRRSVYELCVAIGERTAVSRIRVKLLNYWKARLGLSA